MSGRARSSGWLRRGRTTRSHSHAGRRQLNRILEDFYDRAVSSIASPKERRDVRRLCERRLISGAGRRLTEAEDEIEKNHGVAKETLQQLVDARLLRPDPRLGGVFFELSHDTLVAPILRSRNKRVSRKRKILVGTVVASVIYLGPWWVFAGRQNRARIQALALALTSTPDRNDPRYFLELPRVRLRAIEDQFSNAVGSRKGYGAMMFAAEDVGLRYPELSAEVRKLRNDITQEFNRQHGLEPLQPAQDTLNPRILIQPAAFRWEREIHFLAKVIE